MAALASAGVMAVLSAGPAFAHVNDKVVGANDKRSERQGGVPFTGFIGPVEQFIGSDSYVRAHSGMECGALRSPNITPLGPAGIGFDNRFVCPANR